MNMNCWAQLNADCIVILCHSKRLNRQNKAILLWFKMVVKVVLFLALYLWFLINLLMSNR